MINTIKKLFKNIFFKESTTEKKTDKKVEKGIVQQLTGSDDEPVKQTSNKINTIALKTFVLFFVLSVGTFALLPEVLLSCIVISPIVVLVAGNVAISYASNEINKINNTYNQTI
ncbi:hypothetical protein N9N03_01825 [Chlamydiia bacterium]|nr:hypothetical protein [Chlamydiia bacterium]